MTLNPLARNIESPATGTRCGTRQPCAFRERLTPLCSATFILACATI